MTINSKGKMTAVALATLAMMAADGLKFPSLDGSVGVGREHWKRKKWNKPPSSGPGGPKLRLRIPRKKEK